MNAQTERASAVYLVLAANFFQKYFSSISNSDGLVSVCVKVSDQNNGLHSRQC